MRHWLSAALVAFAVAGCASGPPHVTVQSDEFSKDIKIIGLSDSENPFGGTFREWLIRSWVNKDTGAVSHQLYVDLHYLFAWKFFDAAADDSATPLNIVVIDRHVGNCSGVCDFYETIGVDLNDATLRSRVGKEYRVKISAKSGDAIILPISSAMLALQFAEIDKYAHPLVASGPVSTSQSESSDPGAPVHAKHELGINAVPVPPQLATITQLGKPRGVLVVRVAPDGVAAHAGMKPGDILLTYDGREVAGTDDLKQLIAGTPVGRTVAIGIRRGTSDTQVNAQM